MTRMTLLVTLLALPACAVSPAPAPAQRAGTAAGEEAAVLAVLDRYMAAISAKDTRAMAALQTPDGMTYRARAVEGGGWDVTSRSNPSWADPSRADARTHRERYWSPAVLVRGGIAVVWAPYEFWLDGKTSHCGIDVFDFVRIGGAWRVANAMWTVEPGACGELRPRDASAIRPRG